MDKKSKTHVIIPILFALVFVFWGCHGQSNRYDPRLITADSVLRSNDPDSALRLLDAIDGDKLASAGDRAYHALLLTQAQYRCYVYITSDSIINVALDYYMHHEGEQEKLTRSYLYKGAVTEVLGEPEGAISRYKQAADIAAPDDHFNLGYAKMRIGCLYRDYLVMDSADIIYLKRALHHFQQVPDSFYIATCLSTIGGSYAAVNKNDSALVYLEKADRLIKTLHLTSMGIVNQRYLADLKMFSRDVKDIVESKNIAVSLADKDTGERDHLLLIAVYTLAKLNKPDSAQFYLKQVDKDKLSDGLRVFYNDCFAQLGRCQGDFGQFEHFFRRADDIADSLLTNDMQRKLRDVESKYDNEVLKNKSLRYRYNWIISLVAAALCGGILLAVIVALRRKLARRKRLLRESEDTIERLRDDTARLNEQLNAHQAMSNELKQAIRYQVDMFNQLVEKHVTKFAYSPKKFSEAFERSYSKNRPNDSFWITFRSYANDKYNDIITHSLQTYPSLSDTDLNFLALYCCGFSTSVIMACMGYKEVHSVYNKKHRIEVKLGDGQKFDDYVQLFRGL